jgi:Fic family protein
VKYIHELTHWPLFSWNQESIGHLLIKVRHEHGRLLGRMESLGYKFQQEANLETLTLEVLKTSDIEGEVLDMQQIRSSLARRLGLDVGGLVPSDRNVDGIVEMMLDATLNYGLELTDERLFGWHASLFPLGRSGMYKIDVAKWRENKVEDPMQVISGAMGKEKVHFVAPNSDRLANEMKDFISWFNDEDKLDPVVKSAVAHLWFVTLHPFEDGNGRIARAIAEMQLCRADNSGLRFYSMSAQIRKERSDYYTILERTQKGSLDITEWIHWFIGCFDRSLEAASQTLELVFKKALFWERNTAVILNERQRFMLNKLLDNFEGKLTSSKWAKMTKTSADTALRDILDLIAKNILRKEEGGGRNTNYILER